MAAEARSWIDEGFTAWLAGDRPRALRAAVGALESNAELDAAALLACQLLEGKPATGPACVRLAERANAAGELPMAVAAVALAEKAQGRGTPLRRKIARDFGLGSKRLAVGIGPRPPALAPRGPMPPALADLDEKTLEARLEAALATYAKLALPDPEPVSGLPLFGALPPAHLEVLLGALELRGVPAGQAVITEGEEGREAFVLVRGRLRVERGRVERGGSVERGGGVERTEGAVLAELGPGALFGEMALVSGAPRAASVIVEESALLLVADRVALEKLAKQTPKLGEELAAFCRHRMVENLVLHSPILRALPVEERPSLMERFQPHRFARKERLVAHGEETEGLFLIASGAVKVLGRDADGEPLVITELGPGDVVGEISLVLRRPATADVVAVYQTVALELKRSDFQAAIREHPALLSELYELATKREEELRTVVAQEPLDVEEMVLV